MRNVSQIPQIRHQQCFGMCTVEQEGVSKPEQTILESDGIC